jgi:hypothetical protein
VDYHAVINPKEPTLRLLSLILSFALSLNLYGATTAAPAKGVVIDPDGSPVAKCRVIAVALESTAAQLERYRSDKPERVALATAESSASGEFAIEVTGASTFRLQFEADGFAPGGTIARAGEELGAAMLPRASAKEGRVVAQGKGVAGVHVVYRSFTAEVVRVTDGEGKFRVPDPGMWSSEVFAVDPRFAPELIRRAIGQVPLSIDVREGSGISGKVLAADGKSVVARAKIAVDGWSYGETADDGTFELHHVSPSWNDLMASLADLSARATRGSNLVMTLRLSTSSTFRGRLMDVAGRTPLGGAVVALIQFPPTSGAARQEVVSGSKGDYRFDAVAPGTYQVFFSLPDYFSQSQSLTIPNGESVTRDLFAVRAGKLVGVVIDEDKGPMPGAGIRLARQDAMMSFLPTTAYTAPNGRFVVRVVEPNIDLVPQAVKVGEPEARGAALRLASGERRDIALMIPRGIAFRGKVTGEDGKPLAGVRVKTAEHDENAQWMWPQTLGQWRPDEPSPKTGSDGMFTVRLKPGTYYAAFRLPGYATRSIMTVKVDRGVEPLSVILVKGASISGRVQRAGAPLAEAMVMVSGLSMSPATAGPDGSFVINDLEPGDTQLTIVKDTIRIGRKVTAPADSLVIEVPPGETISGHVVTKDDGRPVTDFRAGLSTAQRMGGQTRYSPPQWKTFRNAEGTFALENVATGVTDVVVSAPGYVVKRASGLNVEEGKGVKDLHVVLETGTTITGTVTGPDDLPLSGVFVGVSVKDSPPVNDPWNSSRGVTDVAGMYSIEQLEPGEKIVMFQKRGYAVEQRTARMDGKAQTIDVRLSKGRELHGRVMTAEGVPVGDAQVQASSPGGQSFGSAKTDDAGSYKMEGLGAGRYTVGASKSGFVSATRRDLDLDTTGGVVDLVLERGAAIHGLIRGLSPTEIQKAEVYATAGSGGWQTANVSADGTYHLAGVPVGTVKVGVGVNSSVAGIRSIPSKTVEVPAGGDLEVNFDVPTGTSVQGRVTRDGKPMTSANVQFASAEVGVDSYSSASVDDRGAYELKGLGPGKYNVTVVEKFTRARLFNAVHEVTAAGESYDIDIKSGGVRGRVTDSGTGNPVEGAVISLEAVDRPDGSYWSRPSGLTGSSGELVIEGVSEGHYKAVAQRPHYAQAMVDLTVDSSGAAQPFELKMTPTEGPLVRVIDARDSRPLSAWISARDARGTTVFEQRSFGSSSDSIHVPLSDGRYRILASVYGYALRGVDVIVPSADVTIALTPGGSLVIQSSGGGSHTAQLIDAVGAVHLLNPYSVDGKFQVDPGTTTLNNIEPGSYTLRVLDTKGATESSVPVTIREGETTRVTR